MNQVRIEKIIEIAKYAGQAIMKVYESEDLDTQQKVDNSPLTRADTASNHLIVSSLKTLTPDIPIVSEEEKIISWSQRKTFKQYWLIDPLDGTKEFIKRNGEFTVNVALVKENRPVLGIVYAPAKHLLYYGADGLGAFKIDGVKDPIQIKVLDVPDQQKTWRVVGSRSHQSVEFQSFLEQFSKVDVVHMGSSLKLCLVAEGKADLYPRLGPTSEWDTAAAQAIVEAAGGQVIDCESGLPLQYNLTDSLLNNSFVVCSKPSMPWYKPKSSDVNIVWHGIGVSKFERAQRFAQKSVIIWFTGLSGAGKSTSACALEKKLFSMGYNTYLLDGDNVRHGLCSDLGFSDRDRSENIRRVGEVAKLMVDAGFIVLASFISPFVRERQMVRHMVELGEYIEVYMNTSIEECERRDPKGLYRKARAGQLKNFTGIDSPYERPENPEIEITTEGVDEVVKILLQELEKLGVIYKDKIITV
ncbi:hypothetical protein AB835_10545 [Candidatus Endobugula sertula]|uniref:Multifunctional fusion protein n=1 Tax=Candidatus Endobugula sertula TaxID=62101 RepID=A0A1D2QNG1_9GAMM|nr:hypothetical protein AB835_10545 [Candidatus Endobugula sertula]